ncbi:MAG: type VI secretion system baseplate subunit TssE, partial [Pseudomonadota bacterium]
MTNRSLLSRIDRAADVPSDVRRHASPEEVAASVIDNIRDLMQMRQGKSQSAPRCGVPDFSDWFLAFSNPGGHLCAAIATMIAEFEPRLRDVVVNELEEQVPGELRFEIIADLPLRMIAAE